MLLDSSSAVSAKRSRKWLVFKGGLLAIVLVVAGVFVYWFVIDPLTRYESLMVAPYREYQFVVNSNGEIRQAFFLFGNNGTKMLTVVKVWVNGTLLNSTEWRFERSVSTMKPQEYSSLCLSSPMTLTPNYCYNFTLGTASGNWFPFLIKVDEAHIKTENLTVLEWGFREFPIGEYYIGVRVKNGPTYTVVRRAEVNGTVFNPNQWIYPNSQTSIIIDHWWSPVKTYHIIIETFAGNIHEFVGKPNS
jgi:hypothetical protein